MSATISLSQDSMIDELLAAGRWRNKSEIIRHGLELVKREVEAENLRPYTRAELAAGRAQMTPDEISEDQARAARIIHPTQGEI